MATPSRAASAWAFLSFVGAAMGSHAAASLGALVKAFGFSLLGLWWAFFAPVTLAILGAGILCLWFSHFSFFLLRAYPIWWVRTRPASDVRTLIWPYQFFAGVYLGWSVGSVVFTSLCDVFAVLTPRAFHRGLATVYLWGRDFPRYAMASHSLSYEHPDAGGAAHTRLGVFPFFWNIFVLFLLSGFNLEGDGMESRHRACSLSPGTLCVGYVDNTPTVGLFLERRTFTEGDQRFHRFYFAIPAPDTHADSFLVQSYDRASQLRVRILEVPKVSGWRKHFRYEPRNAPATLVSWFGEGHRWDPHCDIIDVVRRSPAHFPLVNDVLPRLATPGARSRSRSPGRGSGGGGGPPARAASPPRDIGEARGRVAAAMRRNPLLHGV